MAFQVDSACYESALMAAQSAASKVIGSVVSNGGVSYSVDVVAVSETSISYQFSPVAGGTAFVSVSPFTAQPCNLLTGADGGSLGWMVAAVWIGVYGLLFLTRALRGESEGSYGNT